MRILGLTGSIGMGKTSAATTLRRMGYPVYDADRTVHDLLAKGGAGVAPVAKAFSGVENGGAIDRQALGARVFTDRAALTRLEVILHPLAWHASTRFLSAQARRRARLVILDVPLLLEGGGANLCDKVVVVSAPPFLQRQRVMRRPGMTEAKFAGVRARQMPDAVKRRGADFVVATSLDKRYVRHQLAAIIRRMRRAQGRVWRPGYGNQRR